MTIASIPMAQMNNITAHLVTGSYHHCSWLTKQIHNVSPVTAEWDFKRVFGDARDETKFRLIPKGGSLPRDQKINVEVGKLSAEGWQEPK